MVPTIKSWEGQLLNCWARWLDSKWKFSGVNNNRPQSRNVCYFASKNRPSNQIKSQKKEHWWNSDKRYLQKTLPFVHAYLLWRFEWQATWQKIAYPNNPSMNFNRMTWMELFIGFKRQRIGCCPPKPPPLLTCWLFLRYKNLKFFFLNTSQLVYAYDHDDSKIIWKF